LNQDGIVRPTWLSLECVRSDQRITYGADTPKVRILE
jgi:hypothetical protein